MRWLLALAVVAGCSRTHRVETVPPELLRHEQTVHTRDGRSLEAVALPSREGVAWMTDDRAVIHRDQVVSVSRPNRVRAVFQGIGWGVLVGATLGAITGYAEGGGCGEKSCTSATDGALLGAVVVGGLGIPIGSIVGLLLGSDDIYELVGSPESGRLAR